MTRVMLRTCLVSPGASLVRKVTGTIAASSARAGISTPITSLPFIRAGKVRALAATGATRLSALPDLPTIAELGFPGFSGGTYYSVVVRSGTPQPAIDRLSTEIQRVAAMSELRDTFGPQGIDMAPGTADQLAALLKADRAKYATVIKNAGITLEQ